MLQATSVKTTSVREMSRQMRDMRAQLNEDEDLKVLMASLRGQNLSDADFADAAVEMRLVNVADSDDGESLPLEYDPELIAEYWERRPVAVVTRILQLLGRFSLFSDRHRSCSMYNHLTKICMRRDIWEFSVWVAGRLFDKFCGDKSSSACY